MFPSPPTRPHERELAELGWPGFWSEQPSFPPTGSASWTLLLTNETSLEQFLGV